jgi:hypothetical protein
MRSASTNTSEDSNGAPIRRRRAIAASSFACGETMSADGAGISRISKVMIDLDQADAEAALARRRQFNVTLACGDDVASSYTLQLAVLTAASIGSRCFPGAVRTAISPKLAHAPLLLWP